MTVVCTGAEEVIGLLVAILKGGYILVMSMMARKAREYSCCSWMVEARLGEIVGPGDFGSNSPLSSLKLKHFLPPKVCEDILERAS